MHTGTALIPTYTTIRIHMVLERRGDKKSWLIFSRISSSNLSNILLSRQLSKSAGRPTGMNKELLTKIRCKREAYKRLRHGQMTLEE